MQHLYNIDQIAVIFELVTAIFSSLSEEDVKIFAQYSCLGEVEHLGNQTHRKLYRPRLVELKCGAFKFYIQISTAHGGARVVGSHCGLFVNS